MPFLVLISPEENLKAEVEGCLGALSQRPTLMRVDSVKEFEQCLESLSDVKAVMLDAEAFPPPINFPLPLLLIGSAEDTPYPFLERPLHPESLSFAIEELLRPQPQSVEDGENTASTKLAFVSSLLHEVIHDLNNQFTTLRGNIPFLMEEYPQDDGSLKDIFDATERGACLLHLLEGLDPDTRPDPGIFPYGTLLKDLQHFGKKMIPKLQVEDLSQIIKATPLRGDALLLCNLLLQLLWIYKSATSSLYLTHELQVDTLVLCIIPQEPVTAPDPLKSSIQAFTSKRHPGQVSLEAKGFSLRVSLPRARLS